MIGVGETSTASTTVAIRDPATGLSHALGTAAGNIFFLDVTGKIPGTVITVTGLLTTAMVNAANGVAGLDANGDLIVHLINLADTAANLATVVLAEGELAYARDTKKIAIGDGSTTFSSL